MNLRTIRDKIKGIIFGTNENLPLERRIQILLTFLTAVIFFIGIVFNIIVNLNVWFTALIALSAFIIVIFFFISRNSKNYQRSILPLFLISILLLPAGWFLNAGYDGTIINLIFIYFLAQYAIVKPKYRIIVFLTFVCLSCSLIVIQHTFPEFVLSYANADQRFWDILFSTILYFVLFYFFIDIIVKNYSTENQKIASINEELKIKNKQIAENIIRLEESEETYRVITQSTVDVIFIVDKIGKLLFVNDSVSKYYGYTVDELVGKSFVEFAPASEHQNFLLQLNNVFLNNEVSNYVTQIYHKDGHLVDVELNGKVIKRNGERVSLGTIRDISDRKNAEKKIGEVQKMLYRIINLLPVRIFWKDKDLKYLGCNEIFAHDAGKNNPDELIGKDDFDMGWKEQAELYRVDDKNVIANGLPKLNYEEPQTTSSGNTIWINTSKVPLTNVEGEIVGILGAYEDITDRKQTEEALKESESKYRELYSLIRLMSDTMPDLIWAKDLDNKYIFTNKAMCDKLLGATDTSEPVGKTDLYFALRERDSHPENPQWHTFGELCQDSDVITLKEMKEMQFNEFGNVKGKFLFLDVRKAPLFNNEGKLIGVVGSARDVTEQKKIEETIRLSYHALESISEFLTITDLSDRFTYVNQAFLNAYGYSREEVIGQTPKLIWSENNRKELLREILDQSKVGMWNGEVLNTTKEGREILINLSTSQVKDNEGKIIGLVGVSKDITERKHAEELLRLSEERQRFILESMPVAIYSSPVDPEIDTTWITGDVKKITGFEIEEYLSEPDFWRKRLHPNDAEKVSSYYKDVSLNEEIILEYRWRCKDNQYHWFQDRSILKNNKNQKEYLGLITDITERKRLEKELKENEFRYHNIVDNLHEAYYEADSRAIFTYCNPAVMAISGYTEHELIGMSSLRIVAEEHRANATATYIQWKKDRRTDMSLEFLVQKKHGEKLWVEQTTHYEYDEQGRFIKGANIVKDIHKRKLAEEAMRKSEESYRSIFNTVPVAIFEEDSSEIARYIEHLKKEGVTNFRAYFSGHQNEMVKVIALGKFVAVNDQAIRLFEARSKEELLGSLDRVFLSETFLTLGDMIIALAEGNDGFEGEANVQTLTGKPITIFISVAFVSDENANSHFLVSIIDISDRKRFEEMLQESEIFFRSVWEHSVSGMRLTDESGTIISVNRSFCEMIGKTEKELVKSSLAVMYMESDYSHIVQKHQERFSARTVPAFIEKEVLLWNGKKVWFEVQNSFIDFGNGKILLLGIFSNITEQKNSEHIIRDIQRRESIGVLAGGIAHDFNNLLTSMIGNVSIAQSYIHDGHPAKKNLERIITAAERAATLTKQILAYSGKGRFQIVSVDLIKLVEEYIGLYEASLPKNVSIVPHLSSLPVYVKGDPGQIEQIVMNLIINAGEAIGAKNGIVDVGVFAIEMSDEALKPFGMLNNQVLQSGAYAFFQVTDTGVGMNNETMTKIFDPFFTTKFVGRGLGLSAVLGIIRGHNGGITVYSTENGGTIFQVILPLIKPESYKEQRQENKNIASTYSPTILVIDDEQDVIDMTNDVLTNEKYQHYSALDPEKGVQLFKEHWKTIDLVVLDYSMPKMNGKEVLIELRKIDPDIIVVMSSGYSEEELNHLMGDIKPSAFIQKPHRPKDLLLVIRSLVKDR